MGSVSMGSLGSVARPALVMALAACTAPARLSIREADRPIPRVAVETAEHEGRAVAPGPRAAAPSRASRISSGARPEPFLRALPVSWRPGPAPQGFVGCGAPPEEEDPARAMSLGGGLHLDFGAGDAPYDDGLRCLDPSPETPRGFSDSVLQMGYRGPLWRGASWTGGLAATRYQDEPLLDAMEEAEWAWVVIGVQISF